MTPHDEHHDEPTPEAPKNEYWHIDPDGDGLAGPFATIEEAQTDALKYLHSYHYRITEVRIVKTVFQSSTKVSYDTSWESK